MKNFKKILGLLLVVALTAGITLGITLAYLTDEVETKHNVFTSGNVDVSLTEKTDDSTADVLASDAGAQYIKVVPGDKLEKEIVAENTGTVPAYMAVTITVNNADLIRAAIDEYYTAEGYTEAQIQAVYDEVFEDWGLNYSKPNTGDMRLTITGTDMPEAAMQIDSVLTDGASVETYTGNWFTEDTYTPGMGSDEIKYTYYLYLEPGQSTTLFEGLNVPEYFVAEQMAMFDGLEIDVSAAAIQAENFGTLNTEAAAKAAFTALKGEQTTITAADSAALADAVANADGPVTIVLGEGSYAMPSVGTAENITITGTSESVLDLTKGAYLDSSVVAIEGVTVKCSTGMSGSDYAALYSPNVTYTNCTFDGPFRVGRDGATFINCTFTNLGNDYVWTYGNDVTFEGCVFQSEGKALLIYADGGNQVSQVTVRNCFFAATKSAKAGAIANQACAAIEIDNYGCGVNLTCEGNSYDHFFSGMWRIKSFNAAGASVTVNDAAFTSIAIDGTPMTIDADKNVTVG